jgi:hypothetical protein
VENFEVGKWIALSNKLSPYFAIYWEKSAVEMLHMLWVV